MTGINGNINSCKVNETHSTHLNEVHNKFTLKTISKSHTKLYNQIWSCDCKLQHIKTSKNQVGKEQCLVESNAEKRFHTRRKLF